MEMIKETDIYFFDKEIFGDELEHVYNVDCYDGHAVATLANDSDEKAPKTLYVKYPKMANVKTMPSLEKKVADYRGIEVDDIHYGDIMMACGKLSLEECH